MSVYRNVDIQKYNGDIRDRKEKLLIQEFEKPQYREMWICGLHCVKVLQMMRKEQSLNSKLTNKFIDLQCSPLKMNTLKVNNRLK